MWKSNMLFHLAQISILLVSLFTAYTEGIYCKLKWSSEGYGNIPVSSIASGSNEYVGRAYHNDQWIPGRVSQPKGKIFITENTESIEYDTYEVLTNPDNCILEWVDGFGGNNSPPDSVSVTQGEDPNVLIGRGVIAGLTLGGKVVLDEGAIFISYDGREEMRRSYQILRSFYPPLSVRLSSFKFDVSRGFSNENSTELIGQEDIRNSFNSEILHAIDHGKIVTERFSLTEEHSWNGIARVKFDFPLWYGSSDVTGEFELDSNDPAGTELTVYRDREVRIKRDLTVKAASGTSSNHIQVCSTVNILEDLTRGIEYTATANYEAENMSADQVKIILEKLGRPLTTKNVNRRNAVAGEISGFLNGRFATHLSSYTSVVDSANGVCHGYAKPKP